MSVWFFFNSNVPENFYQVTFRLQVVVHTTEQKGKVTSLIQTSRMSFQHMERNQALTVVMCEQHDLRLTSWAARS